MSPDEKIYNQFSNNTPWRWHRLKLSQSRLMVGPLGAQRATACGRAGKLAALWSWLELGLPVQEDTQHLVTEAEMGRAWVCWPSSMTCYRQGLVLGRMAVEQHQIFLWFSLLLNMERRKTREGKKEKQENNWRCKSISMETRQNKKHVFSPKIPKPIGRASTESGHRCFQTGCPLSSFRVPRTLFFHVV